MQHAKACKGMQNLCFERPLLIKKNSTCWDSLSQEGLKNFFPNSRKIHSDLFTLNDKNKKYERKQKITWLHNTKSINL